MTFSGTLLTRRAARQVIALGNLHEGPESPSKQAELLGEQIGLEVLVLPA